MEAHWTEINSFNEVGNFRGKMIEWLLTDGKGRGVHGIGYLPPNAEPQGQFHSHYGLCWFIQRSVALFQGKEIHGNGGISEDDFKYPIKKIRVLSNEEASEVELSYGYENPFKQSNT